MPPLSPRLVRFSALCGMAAPLLFGFTVGILGSLRPGYSHASQMMSELGETGAPLAPAMNLLGLAGTGILMVLFSLGLRDGLGRTRAATAGSLLVAGAGILYLVMAAFSCDPGCIATTPAGAIHMVAGLLATVVAILSAFVIGYALRGQEGWEAYSVYSLVTGVLVLATLPVFLSAGASAGAWQRVLVGLLFLWMEVIALRLFLFASGAR